ncbi:MAG: diacylglycerol kinase family protein [Nitrospirota bacterium]
MKSLIILINNPTAKKSSDKKILKASRFLKSRGIEVEVFFTEYKGHAEDLAKEALKKSPSLIIAAGGDGTFNEVINGIVWSEIPMAILPLGTTNVLAKELGIPENLEGALETALSRTPKSVSLGRITCCLKSDVGRNQPTRDSQPIARYFCLMAGIGFDGEAVFGINENLKKVSGKGAYIYSGLETLIRFNPLELTFSINGKAYSGYSAVIGKSAKYGGNFKIAPDAKLTDPVLYVCIFRGNKRSDIIRYVLGILMGIHLRFRDVVYLKAKAIETRGDAHIQIDGDYFGKTPAQVEVVSNAVRLIF